MENKICTQKTKKNTFIRTSTTVSDDDDACVYSSSSSPSYSISASLSNYQVDMSLRVSSSSEYAERSSPLKTKVISLIPDVKVILQVNVNKLSLIHI